MNNNRINNNNNNNIRQPNQIKQEDQQKNTIHILGSKDGSCNQMLILYLMPYTMVWYKGDIVSSSHPISRQRQRDDIVHMMSDSFKLKTIAPRSLQNLSTQTCYYIIKKPTSQDGKILIINQAVYKQEFYIDFQKLLTINLDIHEYNTQKHTKIKYLKSILPKQNLPVPLVFTMQSKRDNIITEKYLAVNEKMYLPNARILALSARTFVSKQKEKQMYISGPGFVFFEAQSKLHINKKVLDIVQILALAIILVIFLEYY